MDRGRPVAHLSAAVARTTGGLHTGAASTPRQGFLRPLARIRYQLAGGLLFAVFLPALIRNQFELRPVIGSLENTVLGTGVAMLAGAFALRRMLPYPGVKATAYVLPAFAAAYAAMAVVFLLLRIDYSRFQLLSSFLLAVPWFTFVTTVEAHFMRPRMAVIPVGRSESLTSLQGADWETLQDPEKIPFHASAVVADLRAELPPDWEKFLAACALKGIPIYHSKMVAESLTGRVEIEHLSENNLGSVLPSSIYLRLKRIVDTIGVLAALPILVPVAGIAALLVKYEDGGPILFQQPRVGLGGEVFTIVKFRTMREDASAGQQFTDGDDPRITGVGKFLRRYRIDELPQAWNILRGEMSWIGPRPESLGLSQWYESKIPFYSYRHIVRPGITGWAQVQQGYAAQIAAVTGKLQFDFFYVKHFSPWLDILIVARTIRTILTGFGSR